jgi:hypothetical protein
VTRSYYCCDRRYLGHECPCPNPTEYWSTLIKMKRDAGELPVGACPAQEPDCDGTRQREGGPGGPCLHEKETP